MITRTALVLAAAFIALVFTFPNGQTHEILNGAFIGVGIIIFMTFRRVTVETVLGRGEYKRGQIMALSLAVIWSAATVRTLLSVLYRASNEPQWLLNLPISALITYLFIIAGVMQIAAPSIGQPKTEEMNFMHGHSKGWLCFAITSGVVVAVVVIWLQRVSILG